VIKKKGGGGIKFQSLVVVDVASAVKMEAACPFRTLLPLM
jgi:hypothetical protein